MGEFSWWSLVVAIISAVFSAGAAWASVRYHLNGLRKDVGDVKDRQGKSEETAERRQREMYVKIGHSDEGVSNLRLDVASLLGRIDGFTEMEQSRVMVVQDVQKRTSYLEGKVAVLLDRDEREKREKGG